MWWSCHTCFDSHSLRTIEVLNPSDMAYLEVSIRRSVAPPEKPKAPERCRLGETRFAHLPINGDGASARSDAVEVSRGAATRLRPVRRLSPAGLAPPAPRPARSGRCQRIRS